jgi:hypothetical protein
MLHDNLSCDRIVCGRIQLWDVDAVGRITARSSWKANTIMKHWGYLAAQCIGVGNRDYRIAGMYLEFENVALPGDTVTVPTFNESDDRGYYEDLQISGSRDFLRVPLVAAPIISVRPADADLFAVGEGNRVIFHSQSQGGAGIHGKTFSNAANSKLFGAALVAIPTWSDRTRDVILARTYFEVADQAVKASSQQLGITWEVDFG